MIAAASLALALSCAALAPAAHAQARTAQDHLAQAELFARRGWYADADTELRAALALPDGQDDFALHQLAAQVAWELLDVERAAAMAARAAELAPDETAAGPARALAESYAASFGYVDVQGPHQGLVSRLQIEPEGPIFDADLKRYVNRLSLAMRERTPLPVRLGLPVGSYRINGEAVLVEPGASTTVALPMGALGASGFAALQVTRVEAGVGVGLLAGARVGNLHPAPAAQLGLTQPLGPILVGLVLGGRLDGYSAARSQSVGPLPTWEAGLRVGRELVLAGPLSLRPSLLYRVGFAPGLALACTPEGEAWSCVAEDEAAALDAAPLAVFATSLAHRPGLELALDYREAGRTTALGTGVKLVVDQAIGRLPAEGEALTPEGDTVAWRTEARGWTATGLQMLGTFSFAF